MSKSIVRRLVVVLALSALLGSPATSLAAPRSAAWHSRPQAAQAPLSWLWNALASIWDGAQIKTENGCSGDPYGQCSPKAQATIDNGRLSDPQGHLMKALR
jgi:hypothetical protein